jgi:hypothetical protein
MGVVAKPHCAFVWMMVLALSATLGLPAEDVWDGTYDDSEAAPYELVPLDSISSSPLSAESNQAAPASLQKKVGEPSLCSFAGARFSDADEPSDARVSLAQLCMLRC